MTAKDKIGWTLKIWAKEQGLKLETEYRFHPVRKWKADYAIPGIKVLIEYEGLMSHKSRHTTMSGFTGDCEKYNAMQILGWKVLRYTVINVGQISEDLKLLNIKN